MLNIWNKKSPIKMEWMRTQPEAKETKEFVPFSFHSCDAYQKSIYQSIEILSTAQNISQRVQCLK